MSREDRSVLSENQELKQIENEVDVRRERFAESVALLKTRVEALGNWRAWVTRMPWRAVVGAVVVGWALGRMGSRTRGRRALKLPPPAQALKARAQLWCCCPCLQRFAPAVGLQSTIRFAM